MKRRRAAGAITLGCALVAASCSSSSADVTATESERLRSVVDEPASPPRVSPPDNVGPIDSGSIDADLIDSAVVDLLIPDTIDLPPREISLLDENVPIDLVPSYSSVMRFEATGVEGGERVDLAVEFSGIVDRVHGIGELAVSAEQLAILDDRVQTHPDVDEVVWVQWADDDDQYAFGLLDEDNSFGPPSWARVSSRDAEFTPVFFDEGGLTLGSLGDLLNEDPSSWEREDLGNGRLATHVEYLAVDTLSHADDSIVDVAVGSTGPVRMRIEHDERGVVSIIVIEADFDVPLAEEDGPISLRLQVDYAYPGDVDSIREPIGVVLTAPTVVPNISVDNDVDKDEEDAAIAALPEIELKIIGAWERENHEMIMSVRRDGRVTIVTDRSVYSSTDDFRSLWLTEQGQRRLRDELTATGVFDQAGPQSGGRVGPDLAYAELTVQGSRTFSLGDYHPDRPGIDEVGRAEAEAAVALLTDLSWLDEGDIATPLAPWVPDAMWVSARKGIADRSGLPAPTAVATWPYESTIEEMSTSDGLSAYDEPTVDMCLQGDDVAPLFAMLTGVNHAYLRVDSGGEIWELNVEPSLPGAGSNRC